jgi:hypothetical protein
VHRDVKPSNVLVTPAGFAYLVDFGIARALGTEHTALTGTGQAIGTWAYMAPERFTGAESDHRVDVYALACIRYEVLSGHQPFRGTDLPSAIGPHLHQPPPQARRTRPALPAGLDEVITRGMAKDPAQRYQSAGQLAAAARAALTTPHPHAIQRAPAPPTFVPAPPTYVRRGPREGPGQAPHPVSDWPSLPPPTPAKDQPGLLSAIRDARPDFAGYVAVLLLAACVLVVIERFILGDDGGLDDIDERVVSGSFALSLGLTGTATFFPRFPRLTAPGFMLGYSFIGLFVNAPAPNLETPAESWTELAFESFFGIGLVLAMATVVADTDVWFLRAKSSGPRTTLVVLSGGVVPFAAMFVFSFPTVLIYLVGILILLICARGRFQLGILAGLTTMMAAFFTGALAAYGLASAARLSTIAIALTLATITILVGSRTLSSPLTPM